MLDAGIARWLDAGGEPTIVVDSTGTIIHARCQTEPALGYPPEDLVGQPVAILVPDPAKAAHDHHVRWYAKAPRSRLMGTGLEFSAQRRNGTAYPVEISLTPIGEGGQAVVAATLRDVSERRQHQQALEEREARQNALLGNSADLALLMDASSPIS